MLLQIGFFSLSRQLLLRSHKTKLGTSRRCWGIIKQEIFSIANKGYIDKNHDNNSKQSDQTDNIFNRKLQKFPYRRHDLQATHLTADDIRTLIVEKEAILEDQQDILSDLEQELDELLDKEVLGGT